MVLTRSQSTCKDVTPASFDCSTASSLKENAAPTNLQNREPIKTTHASVSLFTPRIQTRSMSKAQLQPLQEPILEDEHTRQMLARCLGKPPIDNMVPGTPSPASRPNSSSSPSSGRRDPSERPVLTGLDFSLSSRRSQQDSSSPRNETARRRRSLRPALRNRDPQDALEEQGLTARIMVYVRVRPLSKKEKDAGSRSCIRVVDKKDVYVTELTQETDYLRLKRVRGRHFTFDASFPEATGQLEVYSTSTAGLVEHVIEGSNASVFCYGATGAGKTYTMLGTVNQPGVMVLALKDLFMKLKQKSREGDFVVRISYLEVYNEMVRDLLCPGRPLVLREDNKQGIVAQGLTHYHVYSADEVMLLLQRGNQNRATEPTQLNETSSRSHAILQVSAEYKIQIESAGMLRTGKLSLIDLAGSERALATDQRTLRSLEGANINKSLLHLSSCIKALVEGDKHVPYRNSKLTQLLKDSLGGACHTVMIANISPSNLSLGETQNTLYWADSAKEIRTKVAKEVQIPAAQEDQTKLLLEMQKENHQLRFELASLKQKYIALQNSIVGGRSENPLSPSLTAPRQRAKVSARSPCTRIRDDNGEVKELRNVIRKMEKDAERTQLEHRKKVEELSATITALSRERLKAATTVTSPRPHATKQVLTSTLRAAPQVTEQKMKPPKKPSSSPTPSAPPESQRFLSPAKAENVGCKKRSFWDIAQTFSPSTTQRARTRSTPSMLLQPGFARRRQSQV